MGGFYSAKFAGPEPSATSQAELPRKSAAPAGDRLLSAAGRRRGRGRRAAPSGACVLDAAPRAWDEERVITERADGVELRIWAKPRGSRTRVTGIRKGTDGLDLLEVALGAPPVDGAANAELLDFLARQLEVSKRSVVLSRGASSREKVVQILGVDRNQVIASLGL